MNIISRITHQAASNLFSRITAVKSIESSQIHILYSKQNCIYRNGENEQLKNLHYESLLQPTSPILHQLHGMKYKVRLQLRCKGCYYVTRKEVMYVMCKLKPRHKQSAITKKEKNTWIWTEATQSPKRPW